MIYYSVKRRYPEYLFANGVLKEFYRKKIRIVTTVLYLYSSKPTYHVRRDFGSTVKCVLFHRGI